MATEQADPPQIYKMIGERIRDERQKRHLTQDELASRVGLKRASITNVEKGRQKLLVHTLVQIADSLGTSPARFLTAFDTKAPIMLPDNLSASVRNWILHSVEGSTSRSR
jgi:transcriptional regulator with XRE-family HTH domain